MGVTQAPLCSLINSRRLPLNFAGSVDQAFISVWRTLQPSVLTNFPLTAHFSAYTPHLSGVQGCRAWLDPLQIPVKVRNMTVKMVSSSTAYLLLHLSIVFKGFWIRPFVPANHRVKFRSAISSHHSSEVNGVAPIYIRLYRLGCIETAKNQWSYIEVGPSYSKTDLHQSYTRLEFWPVLLFQFQFPSQKVSV